MLICPLNDTTVSLKANAIQKHSFFSQLCPSFRATKAHRNSLTKPPATHKCTADEIKQNTIIILLQFYTSVGSCWLKQSGHLRRVPIPPFPCQIKFFKSCDKNEINKIVHYNAACKSHNHKDTFSLHEMQFIVSLILFKQQQASNTTPDYYS